MKKSKEIIGIYLNYTSETKSISKLKLIMWAIRVGRVLDSTLIRKATEMFSDAKKLYPKAKIHEVVIRIKDEKYEMSFAVLEELLNN